MSHGFLAFLVDIEIYMLKLALLLQKFIRTINIQLFRGLYTVLRILIPEGQPDFLGA
jgi:hypothetical protein